MIKINKYIGCVIFLLSISSIPAIANNLSVTVLEKGSGDAIEGATVVLGESGEYDVTDERGHIEFDDAPEGINIKVLNPGHETLETPFAKTELENNSHKMIFYLYPITVESDGLEVIEDRIQEKASKITLVEEELRRVPGTAGDPLKVMTSLPGIVSGQDPGGGPSQLLVRGSGGEDNGVLINRIPVDYLYHFGDLSGIAPSTINPSLVKDFNVFLGGFPVEYDDKLGGILDVQLRNPKKDRLHQTYRIAFHESSFLIEGPVQEKNDNDSFYIAGRVSYLDRLLTPETINKAINGDKTPEDSDFSIVTLPRYYDAQANWHRELKKGSLDFYYFTAGDSISANLNNLVKSTDPALIGKISIEMNYHSIGANWLHRYSNNLSHISTWAFRQSNFSQIIGTDPTSGKPFFLDIKEKHATYDPQFIWRVRKNHEITTGVNVVRTWAPIDLNISVKPTEDNPNLNFTSTEKFQLDTIFNAASLAPYVKHRWAINKKLTTFTGLRYSYIKASDGIQMSGFSPRAAIEYQFNQKLLLNASWGKYLQIPAGETIITGVGNPNLGFTKAEHRIIGAELKPTPLWLIKLEGYQKPMEKLVLYIPNQVTPKNYQNIGKGEAYGIDLLIKREFFNRTLGWLSYSYAKSSRTTVQGEDRDFTGDRPHTLNVVWSQPMTGGWKRWTWGVKMTIQSGSTYTPVIGRKSVCKNDAIFSDCADQELGKTHADFSHWRAVRPDKLNTRRFPFYYQMSLRFDRDIRYNTWKMNFFVDIQNLTFFRKNIVSYNYGNEYEKIDNPEAVSAFYFPLPLLGIEAKF